MSVHTPRQLVTGVALAGTLAFVAACSGPSSSMNPTSPSAAASAAAGASFSPNGDPVCGDEGQPPCETPCEKDPTLAECKLQGRFTGGGFQIDENGVKVTRGFTLHCDEILSNNFEVNWAGGNKFHTDKNPTTVRCTREGIPNPPDAAVNLIEVTGPGRLNGVAGASIRIILIDNGEPGTEDQAFIQVFNGSGGTVLRVGGEPSPNTAIATIDGGNIQAHFDQPHKR